MPLGNSCIAPMLFFAAGGLPLCIVIWLLPGPDGAFFPGSRDPDMLQSGASLDIVIWFPPGPELGRSFFFCSRDPEIVLPGPRNVEIWGLAEHGDMAPPAGFFFLLPGPPIWGLAEHGDMVHP